MRSAAAVAQSTAAGNKVLVGYVVGEVCSEDVRAAVAEHLPDGLAPVVVVLDEMPLARAPGRSTAERCPGPRRRSQRAPDATLTGTKAWLAERFADQLGPVAISVHTDFFASGGNSLGAAKLVSALRERFPSVAVADVYEHRRLGDLARRLEELSGRARAAARGETSAPWRWAAAQFVGMLVLLVVQASEWLIAAFAYGNIVGAGLPHVGWGWLIAAWLCSRRRWVALVWSCSPSACCCLAWSRAATRATHGSPAACGSSTGSPRCARWDAWRARPGRRATRA